MKNILAAVDFSDVTAGVLEQALRQASIFGAQLWIVHVAAPDPDFVGYGAGPQVVRDQLADHLREEHRELQQIAEEARATGVQATALLVQGPTVDTVLAEAARLQADLVVIGSHGHGRLYRMVVGSVSEGILRRSRLPVLLVPAQTR